MPPRKTVRSTRSRSCGRLPSEGLSETSSHAHDDDFEGGNCLSPTHNTPLPSKQDSEKVSRASNLPRSSKNIINADTLNNNKSENQEKNGISTVSHIVSETEIPTSTTEHASTVVLSDNRATVSVSDQEQLDGLTVILNDNRATDSASGQEKLGIEKEKEKEREEREHEEKDSLPPSKPDDPWHFVYQELRTIRERVASLEKIEKSTELHTQQLGGIVQRTSTLEKSMDTAKDQIGTLNEEVSTLKELVETQSKTIAQLKHFKEEMDTKNKKTVAEMSQLIKKQQGQVDGFHECTAEFKKQIMGEVEEKIGKVSDEVTSAREYTTNSKKEILEEVDGKIGKVSNEVKYNSLKSKANYNKDNLVITGLKEDPQKTDFQMASSFFKDSLKIKNLDIDMAYRLGTLAEEGSSYTRPLVVKLPRASDRRRVWAEKTDITEEDGTFIRIQADLPKRLRDDSLLLNRVAKAASKIPRFKSARVRDYSLVLHGKTYAPNELEQLPLPLRPSTLATPRSTSAIAFFSKHSELSNHYSSRFTLRGIEFHSMEHFLAYRRALLSGQQEVIEKALKVKDPAAAKSILNSLKKNKAEEWKEQAPSIAEEGLRAKFRQDQYLLEFLLETGDLPLGEASRDTFWGVGMTLTHPDVLDVGKWPPEGNLLGRTLAKIRDEMRAPSTTATQRNSPKKNRRK